MRQPRFGCCTGVQDCSLVLYLSSMQLSAVRHGNIPLATANHALVLHWNRQAPLLLRQLASNGHGDSRTLGRWAQGAAGELLPRLPG